MQYQILSITMENALIAVRIRLQNGLQGNFDSGSRGVHISNEMCAQILRFCVVSCFLAAYNRFAAHEI